jgi:acyl carrier protein
MTYNNSARQWKQANGAATCMQTFEVYEKIKSVLTRILEENGFRESTIAIDSSLVADLGFTSFMFVDLTLALESAFRLNAFPIQEWIDEQMILQDSGFRVRSLVEKCESLLTK